MMIGYDIYDCFTTFSIASKNDLDDQNLLYLPIIYNIQGYYKCL
jgi:hypothetical protein